VSLSAALAAYYALDESSGTATAADSHTNAAHLSTVTGTPTVIDPGKVGKARQFSGADVRVEQGADEANVRLGYDRDWSVSFWLKYSSVAIPVGVNCVALVRGGASGEFLVTYTTVSDAIQFWLFEDLPGWQAVGSVTGFGDDAWHHFVFRFNGTSKRCRLDADGANEFDNSPPVLPGGRNYVNGSASVRLIFGTIGDGGLHAIDEVGIWASATGGGGELEDADVVDLYNSGAGRDYAYVSAGGGGGFQSAWARGSNVMILPGAL